MDNVNVTGYLTVMWLFLGCISTHIVWKYGNHKNFSIDFYPTIWIQYFSAIGIILLVPLDVFVTVTGRKNKNYYDKNNNIIIQMYLSFYWTILILSNIVLVFQELYHSSGYFTIFAKIKDILTQTIYQIIFVIVIGSIFFGILVGKHVIEANINAFLLTSILITNTVGLIVLVFLLGYGLIMFPKTIWNLGDYKKTLEKMQYLASMEYENMSDARFEISLCVADILKTKNEFPNKFDTELNYLIKMCPTEFTLHKAGKIALDPNTNTVTINSLAKLKSSLYWNKLKYVMAQKRIEKIQQSTYILEDIINSIDSTDRTIKWSFKKHSSNLEYYWLIYVYPNLCKFFGLVFGATSILSYLSVIGSMKGIPFNVSPYFVVVHDETSTSIGIVIFVLLTLGYICYVTMWSLFQIKMEGIMELVEHSTCPVYMSFNSRRVASLVGPIAFFYLGWIHENQIIGGNFEDTTNGNEIYTAFSQFYQIHVIPIMGNSFNMFFPILMICVSFMTITNLLNRIFVMVGYPKLQFGETIISTELLYEGKKKLLDKKRQLIRKYEREQNSLNKIIKKPKISSIIKPKKKYLLQTNEEDFSLDDIGFSDII